MRRLTLTAYMCLSFFFSLLHRKHEGLPFFHLSFALVSVKGGESSNIPTPTVPWAPINVYVKSQLIPGNRQIFEIVNDSHFNPGHRQEN